MKKRKFSLLLNIATIALCVCAIAIGVYSAKTASLNISGSIGFTAHNCKVNISGKLEGAYKKLSASSTELTPCGTKYFNSTSLEGGETLTLQGGINDQWEIGDIFFNDLDCGIDEIATPIVFTFELENAASYYDISAEVSIVGDLALDTKAAISFSGASIQHGNACVLPKKSDDSSAVTVTISFVPVSYDGFTGLNLSNLSLNFAQVQSAEQYEYLDFSTKDASTNVVKIKPKDTSTISGDIVVPCTVSIDDTNYLVDLCDYDGVPTDSPFYGCKNMTSISLPNSVTKLPTGYFYECTSLKSIIIPYSVTLIDFVYDSVFTDCSSLLSLEVPSSVESFVAIGFLKNCTALTTFKMSDATTLEKPGNMFVGCKSLTNLKLTKKMTGLDQSMFSGCSQLTSFTIPEGFTYIPDYVFYDCSSLTTITIPRSVINIGHFVFSGCSNLTTVIFEDSESTWNVCDTSGPIIYADVSVSNPSENATKLTDYIDSQYGWRKNV